MQTANQSLASHEEAITLEMAMNASSNRDELRDMISRGVGVVAGAGPGGRPASRRRGRRGRGGRSQKSEV